MKEFFSGFTFEDILLYLTMIGVLVFFGYYLDHQSNLISKPLTEMNEISSKEFLQLSSTQLRYDYASRVLLTNTSRNNLSFLIGSILCILGSLIIVRRVRTETNTLNAKSINLKLSLQSNSPGLIMVFLGTVIILSSIYFKDKYEMSDNGGSYNGSETIMESNAAWEKQDLTDILNSLD